MNKNIKFVLASGSSSRAQILSSAGIDHLCDRPEIDESALKQSALREGITVETTSQRLALAKANAVGLRHSNKFVLGCDQILDCQGDWFDKPVSVDGARIQLKKLRGKTHRLVNGLVMVHDGAVVWSYTAIASLTMRTFSDEFLDAYLKRSGKDILSAVGAYHIEALGIQLFDHIEGDYYSILGLPLLPLVSFLRQQNIIES